ncbi:ABC transporter ATP-binding protein [Litoribacillus peritrichatus]|uniref:ABC transporter ATP-binding protein n=1 Tax=Litoribacillus peritrichatus TaxID=718191 RepID=A0ABP7M2M4_9GAMM
MIKNVITTLIKTDLVSSRYIILLCCFGLILSLAEVFTVYSLVSFFNLLQNSDDGNEFMAVLLETLYLNDVNIVLASGIILLVSYVLLTFLRVFVLRMTTSGAAFEALRLSKELYNSVSEVSPYFWRDLGEDSSISQLQRIQSITFSVIIPVANLLVSVMVATGLIVMISAANVIIVGIALIAGGLSIVFVYKPINRKVKIMSEPLDESIQDRVDGLLDLVKTSAQRCLQKSYAPVHKKTLEKALENDANYFNSVTSINFYNLLPKYLIELFIFLGILVSVFVSIEGTDATEAAATLAMVGLGVLRAFPYLNAIHFNFAKLLSSWPQYLTFSDFIHELKRYKFSKNESLTNKLEFEFNSDLPISLTKSDEKETKKIIFRRGQWFKVIGPSGSGKSTLVNAMLFGDNPIWSSENMLTDFGLRCGYVQQEPRFSGGSIYNGFNMQEDTESKMTQLQTLMELFGLEELTRDFETLVNQKNPQLSGGQWRRICIIKELMLYPDILVLDETLGAISIEQEHEVLNQIRRNFPDLILVEISHRKTAMRDYQEIVSV